MSVSTCYYLHLSLIIFIHNQISEKIKLKRLVTDYGFQFGDKKSQWGQTNSGYSVCILGMKFGWLGWVWWHINICRLFNAKSSLYIYIKYIGFSLIGFYGISTIVGYLMPNPLYTYIFNIYGGTRGVMVIIVGNEHGDTSSNPGWDWWHFT